PPATLIGVFAMSSLGVWPVVLRTTLVFLLCVYLSRAPALRVLASIAGGVAFAVGNVVFDFIAYRAGLWSYPGLEERSHGQLAWSAAVGIAVAGIALIGWRVHRRYKQKGLVIFLLAFAAFGLVRDWAMSRTAARGILVFGAGAIPWIADYIGWLVLTTVAIMVQFAIAGDSARD